MHELHVLQRRRDDVPECQRAGQPRLLLVLRGCVLSLPSTASHSHAHSDEYAHRDGHSYADKYTYEYPDSYTDRDGH